MKVIDLLKKIANGEKVPMKIKYQGNTYLYNEDENVYEGLEECVTLMENVYECDLNDEIEILDEEDEFIDIEEITQECFDNWTCAKHINDLIKNQKLIINKLKEEGK